MKAAPAATGRVPRIVLFHCDADAYASLLRDRVADYVMTALAMLQSDFPGLLRDHAAKRWQRRPVLPLAGRTLGIVGLGAIGREIARRAVACGMEVIGVRRSGAPLEGVARMYRPEEIRRFLPLCDAVVLAVPATDDTRAMIGRAEFAAMKASASPTSWRTTWAAFRGARRCATSSTSRAATEPAAAADPRRAGAVAGDQTNSRCCAISSRVRSTSALRPAPNSLAW